MMPSSNIRWRSQLAQLGVLADPLGNDVAGAFEGVLDAGHFLLRANEGGSELGAAAGRWAADSRGSRQAVPGPYRERLSLSSGASGGKAGTDLPARSVECGFDLRLQLIGQLALLLDGGEDGLAAAEEIAEVGELLFDGANLHLVEIAGGLLAIASDERYGAALVEQTDDRDQRVHGDIEGVGDLQQSFGGQRLSVKHSLLS